MASASTYRPLPALDARYGSNNEKPDGVTSVYYSAQYSSTIIYMKRLNPQQQVEPMPWTWQHIDTADVLTSIWFAMITMFESHDDGNDDDPQKAFVEQIERLQLTTGSHLDQVPIRELQSFALYRHPWFTEKWRLRHSAEVGAAWDNFMRQSQSALTMPLPEGLAADREQAYSLLIVNIVGCLRNSLLGLALIYDVSGAPEGWPRAVFAGTLYAKNLVSNEKLANVGLLVATLDTWRRSVPEFSVIFDHISASVDAYAAYLNAALAAGNTAGDVYDTLEADNVKSPVYERLSSEMTQRNHYAFVSGRYGPAGRAGFVINDRPPYSTLLPYGYGHTTVHNAVPAVDGPDSGKTLSGSLTWYLQMILETSRSTRICRCRLAYASDIRSDITQHDESCPERFWGRMPLPNLYRFFYEDRIQDFYKQVRLLHGELEVGVDNNQQVLPSLRLYGVLWKWLESSTVITDPGRFSCTTTPSLTRAGWEFLLSLDDEKRKLIASAGKQFERHAMRQLVTGMMVYHRSFAADGSSSGVIPYRSRTQLQKVGDPKVALDGMQAYALVQSLSVIDTELPLSLGVQAPAFYGPASELHYGAGNQRYYRNDAYCMYEAFKSIIRKEKKEKDDKEDEEDEEDVEDEEEGPQIVPLPFAGIQWPALLAPRPAASIVPSDGVRFPSNYSRVRVVNDSAAAAAEVSSEDEDYDDDEDDDDDDGSKMEQDDESE